MSYRQVVTGVDVKCAVCDAVATAAEQQQRDSPWRAHEEMQAAAWEAESERVAVKEGLDGRTGKAAQYPARRTSASPGAVMSSPGARLR